MTKRFYIGKQDIKEDSEELEVWIDSKIPPPPDGQVCECDECSSCEDNVIELELEACPAPATTYLYTIKDEHVCYTWMCDPCMEAQSNEGYLGDVDYPTTEAGYARVPSHCA